MIRKTFFGCAWTFIGLSVILLIAALFVDTEPESEALPDYVKYQSSIEPAHEAQVTYLQGFYEDNAEGGDPAYTMRSESHELAYWVSLPTVVNGQAVGVGVWLCSGAKDNPGMCLPASGFATEYSMANSLKNTEAWSMYDLEPINAMREYTEDQMED